MKAAKAKAKRPSESCATPSSHKHVIDRDDEESPSALTRKKKKSETYQRSPLTSPFESTTSPLSGAMRGAGGGGGTAAHHSPLTSPNVTPLPTPIVTPSGTPRPSVTHIALTQQAAATASGVGVQSGIGTPVRPTTPTHRSTPPESGVPEKRRKSGESSESPVRAPLPGGVPETADPSGEVTMASASDIPSSSEQPPYPRLDSDDVMRSVSPTNRSQRPLPREQASSDLDISDSDNEPTAAELDREGKTMYNRHALMRPPRLRTRHNRANSQLMNDDDTPTNSSSSNSSSALKAGNRSASAVVPLSTSSPAPATSHSSPTKSPAPVVNTGGEVPSSSSPAHSAASSRLRVHGSAGRGGESVSAVNRSQSEDVHLFQMTDSEFDVFEGTHVGHDDIMNLEKLEISRNTSNFFPHSFEALKNLKSLKLEDNQMSTLPRAFMADPIAARKQRARSGSVSIGGVATGSGGQPTSSSSASASVPPRARASTVSAVATPQNGNSSSEEVPDAASMSSDSASEDGGSNPKASRPLPDSSSGTHGDHMELSELKEIVLHQREVERVDLALTAQRVPQLESLSIANYGVSNFAGATQYFRNVRGLRLRKVGLVSLPMSINNLHILEILDVSYNSIKVLPGTICKLKLLRVVNCSHNQLGILPAALGDMPKLDHLDVSFNLLRGLPLNFGKLKPKCKVNMANNPATQHDNNKRAKHRSKRKLFSPEITTPLVPSKGHTYSTTVESKTSADVTENKTDSPQQNSRDARSSSSERGGRRRLYKATRRRVSQTNVHAGTDSESSDQVEMGCPSFLRSGSPAFGTLNSRVPGAKAGDATSMSQGRHGTGTLPGGASSRGASRSNGRDGLSSTDSLKLVSHQSRSDGVQPSKRIKRDNVSQDNSRERYSMGYLHYSDTLADGFYDCGRLANHSVDLADLVTMKLSLTENPAIREIILVDSTKDAALAEILQSARDVVMQDAPMKARVHMLALFVSDSLGGRTNGPAIKDLCQENIQRLRINNNTNIIRLGDLSHGLCRHRSILFKYLADSLEPRIPCSLVRGYRIVNARASAHSWNLVKVDDEEMLLDILEAPHILQNPFPELDFSAGAYIPQFLVSTVLYEEFNNASVVQTVTLEHLKDVYEAKWDKKLGEGSYAKVFDGQLAGSTVAVKVSPCHSYDEHTFARVLREIWIHSSMNHPNIVRFLGYLIRPPQELRVFMERVHGLSLFHVARKRRQAYREHQKRRASSYYAVREPQGPPIIFNTFEILYIATCVAKGVAYLHSRNIMHRDLKSDNILMGTAFPLRPQLEDTDMTSQTSPRRRTPAAPASRLPTAPRTDQDHPLFLPTPNPVAAPSTAWGVKSSDYASPMGQNRGGWGAGGANAQAAWRNPYAPPTPEREPVLGEDGLPVFDPLTSMTHFHVKVCDFNVSCVAGPGPKELEYVGTLRWIAPEVLAARYSLNHRSVYSHSCDIRSFGMILLEIISGAIPYSEYDKKQGATLESLTQHILKGNLPDVTPYEVGAAIAADPLRAVLYRMAQDCLQFEPAKRPTAEALVAKLDDLAHKYRSSINMYNHRLMRM